MRIWRTGCTVFKLLHFFPFHGFVFEKCTGLGFQPVEWLSKDNPGPVQRDINACPVRYRTDLALKHGLCCLQMLSPVHKLCF